MSYAGLDITKIVDLQSFEKDSHLRWAKNFLPAFPESAASVEDAWKGSGERTVVLIQDAHTNNSGQLNEARLLDALYSARPDFASHVFLEAGSGDESLSFLRDRAPAEKRLQVAKSRLSQALLQGTEYVDLTTSHRFTLWGVEDMALYAESIEDYRKSAAGREKFAAYLDRVQAAIDALKPKLLNPFLLAFEEIYQKNERHEIAATDYLQVLTAQARKLGLPSDYPHLRHLDALRELERSIDFKKAGEEQQKLVASLSDEDRREIRDVLASPDRMRGSAQKAYFLLLREKIRDVSAYPNFGRYLEYLKRAEEMNSAELLKEEKALEGAVFAALTTGADEESLILSARRTAQLRKLLFLQFTPDDYREYRKDKESFDIRRITGFLNRKILDKKEHYDRALFLEDGYDDAISACERFYELTYRRDEKFVENMLKVRAGPVSILVTGGYHSPNLKYLLKQKNISYVSLVPQVLQETNLRRYEDILLGQKIPARFLEPSNDPQADMTMRTILGGRLEALARDLGLGEDEVRDAEAIVAARASTVAKAGARLASREKPVLDLSSDPQVWINPRTAPVRNPLSRGRFEGAYAVLKPVVTQTPLYELKDLEDAPKGMRVFYKDESRQEGGSFKWRGVYYEVHEAIARVLTDPRAKKILSDTLKIVTQSTGNHGIAMIRAVDRAASDFAARETDPETAALIRTIEPVVFTLKNLSPAKRREMLRQLEEYRARFGAGRGSVLDQFENYEAALRERQAFMAAQGEAARYMDHGGEEIMLGHGSAGIEIAEQLKAAGISEDDKVVIVVPVGAGGPIGIPAALKNFRKNTVAVLVQPSNRNAFVRSLKTGTLQTNPKKIDPVTVIGFGEDRRPVVFADGVDVDGPENMEAVDLAREYADAVVGVDETRAYAEEGPVLFNSLLSFSREAKVGGTSATTLAALLQYGDKLPVFKDAKAVVLFGTEGNVDDDVLSNLMQTMQFMGGSGLGARLASVSLRGKVEEIVKGQGYPDDVRVEIDPSIQIKDDPRELGIVIFEILKNAIDGSRIYQKKTGQPAYVRIAAERDGETVRLRVENCGVLPLDKLRAQAKEEGVWGLMPGYPLKQWQYPYLSESRITGDEPMPYRKLRPEQIDALSDDDLLFRVRGLTLRRSENLARIGMSPEDVLGGAGIGLKLSWRIMQESLLEAGRQIHYESASLDGRPAVAFTLTLSAAAVPPPAAPAPATAVSAARLAFREDFERRRTELSDFIRRLPLIHPAPLPPPLEFGEVEGADFRVDWNDDGSARAVVIDPRRIDDGPTATQIDDLWLRSFEIGWYEEMTIRESADFYERYGNEIDFSYEMFDRNEAVFGARRLDALGLKDLKGKRLFYPGAGSAGLAYAAAERGAQVLATDPVVSMKTKMEGFFRRRAGASAKLPRYETGRLTQLPADEAPFDYIVLQNTLFYFPPALRRKIVSNLVDRLVPGGKLFIIDGEKKTRGGRWFEGTTREEMAESLLGRRDRAIALQRLPNEIFGPDAVLAVVTNASWDGARLAETDARAIRRRLAQELFLKSGLQNGVLSVSLADLSSYVTSQTGGAPYHIRYQNAFQILKELIPEYSRQGVRKIYLNGMIFPVAPVSKEVHTVPTSGEYFIVSDGRTAHRLDREPRPEDEAIRRSGVMVRIFDYDTSRAVIPMAEGDLVFTDSNGNPFSLPTMKRFNPLHGANPVSPGTPSADPMNETDPSLDAEFREVVEVARKHGIDFTVDYIPWIAPDAVTPANYKRFFYRELSPAENERYRTLSGREQLEWLKDLLRRSPGWFVRELPEEADAAGGAPRPPRVVLVKHLQGANIDQALPNPYHPENRKYYREVFERFFEMGVYSFRVDLGHLLLKMNTRGYLQEIGQLNGERTGESLEQWIARSGMAYDEATNPDGIRPGESFDSWWDRQRDVWDETLRNINEGNKVTPELVFETYSPADQDEILAITPAAVYYKGLFSTIMAFLSADRRNPSERSRPSAEWFKGVIDHMVAMGPFLWGFLSNFDQATVMIYVRRFGWSDRTIESFLALGVVMQKIGATVMMDKCEWMGYTGRAMKTAGGNNPADPESFHASPGSLDEMQRRRALVDAGPEGVPQVKSLDELRRSPGARAVEQFPKEFFESEIIDYRFLNNSYQSRFLTVGLETKEHEWFVVTIDMKPESGVESSEARQRGLLQVQLPQQAFPSSASSSPLAAWVDRTPGVAGLAREWVKPYRAGSPADSSSSYLLDLRYDWSSGMWGTDPSRVPVKVVKLKALVEPPPSASSSADGLHARSLEALQDHRTYRLFNFLSREILDPARRADPDESKRVLLASMLFPDYWIRAYAANAAALRVRVAAFARPEIYIMPKMLNAHVADPLISVREYDGWNPVAKLGRPFGEEEQRRARRNKRYYLIWTASHLVTEKSFQTDRIRFRKRFTGRMKELLEGQAAAWTAENEARVLAAAASGGVDMMAGTDAPINFLELMRMIYVRNEQVHRLQTVFGYSDSKYWLIREVMAIVDSAQSPRVREIVTAPVPSSAGVQPLPLAESPRTTDGARLSSSIYPKEAGRTLEDRIRSIRRALTAPDIDPFLDELDYATRSKLSLFSFIVSVNRLLDPRVESGDFYMGPLMEKFSSAIRLMSGRNLDPERSIRYMDVMNHYLARSGYLARPVSRMEVDGDRRVIVDYNTPGAKKSGLYFRAADDASDADISSAVEEVLADRSEGSALLGSLREAAGDASIGPEDVEGYVHALRVQEGRYQAVFTVFATLADGRVVPFVLMLAKNSGNKSATVDSEYRRLAPFRGRSGIVQVLRQGRTSLDAGALSFYTSRFLDGQDEVIFQKMPDKKPSQAPNLADWRLRFNSNFTHRQFSFDGSERLKVLAGIVSRMVLFSDPEQGTMIDGFTVDAGDVNYGEKEGGEPFYTLIAYRGSRSADVPGFVSSLLGLRYLSDVFDRYSSVTPKGQVVYRGVPSGWVPDSIREAVLDGLVLGLTEKPQVEDGRAEARKWLEAYLSAVEARPELEPVVRRPGFFFFRASDEPVFSRDYIRDFIRRKLSGARLATPSGEFEKIRRQVRSLGDVYERHAEELGSYSGILAEQIARLEELKDVPETRLYEGYLTAFRYFRTILDLSDAPAGSEQRIETERAALEFDFFLDRIGYSKEAHSHFLWDLDCTTDQPGYFDDFVRWFRERDHRLTARVNQPGAPVIDAVLEADVNFLHATGLLRIFAEGGPEFAKNYSEVYRFLRQAKRYDSNTPRPGDFFQMLVRWGDLNVLGTKLPVIMVYETQSGPATGSVKPGSVQNAIDGLRDPMIAKLEEFMKTHPEVGLIAGHPDSVREAQERQHSLNYERYYKRRGWKGPFKMGEGSSYWISPDFYERVLQIRSGARLASIREERLPENLPKDVFVISPVYNEEKRLDRTIQKAREGGYLDRLIFIDDASTDGSAVLLRSYPDVFYVSFAENQQKEGAIDAGLARLEAHYRSKGVPFPQYFAAVDSDTFLVPSKKNSTVEAELAAAAARLKKESAQAMSFVIRADLGRKPTLFQWVQGADWHIGGNQIIGRILSFFIALPARMLSVFKIQGAIPGGGGIFDVKIFRQAVAESHRGFLSGPLDMQAWFAKKGFKILFPFRSLIARTEVERTFLGFVRERGKWAYGMRDAMGWKFRAAVAGGDIAFLGIPIFFGGELISDLMWSVVEAVSVGLLISVSFFYLWRAVVRIASFRASGSKDVSAGFIETLLLFFPLAFSTLVIYGIHGNIAAFAPAKRKPSQGARLAQSEFWQIPNRVFLRMDPWIEKLSNSDREIVRRIIAGDYGNPDALQELIDEMGGRVYIKADEINPFWGEGRKIYLELDAESRANSRKEVLAFKGIRPASQPDGTVGAYDHGTALGYDSRPFVFKDGTLAIGTPTVAPIGGMTAVRAVREYEEMRSASGEKDFGTEKAVAVVEYQDKKFRGENLAVVVSALDGPDERLALGRGARGAGERVLHASSMKTGLGGERFRLQTSLEYMREIGKALRGYHFRRQESLDQGKAVRRFHRYPHLGNIEMVRAADGRPLRVVFHDLDTTVRSEDFESRPEGPEFLETAYRLVDLLTILNILYMRSSLVPDSPTSDALAEALVSGYFYDVDAGSLDFRLMMMQLRAQPLYDILEMMKRPGVGRLDVDPAGPLGANHPFLGQLWTALLDLRGREEASLAGARLAASSKDAVLVVSHDDAHTLYMSLWSDKGFFYLRPGADREVLRAGSLRELANLLNEHDFGGVRFFANVEPGSPRMTFVVRSDSTARRRAPEGFKGLPTVEPGDAPAQIAAKIAAAIAESRGHTVDAGTKADLLKPVDSFRARAEMLMAMWGVDLATLAGRVGVTEGTVKEWFAGRQRPVGRHLMDLAHMLNADASLLFYGKPLSQALKEVPAGKSAVASRIEILVRMAGLTLAEASQASEVGADLTNVGAWKTQGLLPHAHTIKAVCDYFGVDASMLFEGESVREVFPKISRARRLEILRNIGGWTQDELETASGGKIRQSRYSGWEKGKDPMASAYPVMAQFFEPYLRPFFAEEGKEEEPMRLGEVSSWIIAGTSLEEALKTRDLPARIRLFLDIKGLSINELAQKLGTSNRTASDWVKNPKDDRLQKICEAMGVSVAEVTKGLAAARLADASKSRPLLLPAAILDDPALANNSVASLYRPGDPANPGNPQSGFKHGARPENIQDDSLVRNPNPRWGVDWSARLDGVSGLLADLTRERAPHILDFLDIAYGELIRAVIETRNPYWPLCCKPASVFLASAFGSVRSLFPGHTVEVYTNQDIRPAHYFVRLALPESVPYYFDGTVEQYEKWGWGDLQSLRGFAEANRTFEGFFAVEASADGRTVDATLNYWKPVPRALLMAGVRAEAGGFWQDHTSTEILAAYEPNDKGGASYRVRFHLPEGTREYTLWVRPDLGAGRVWLGRNLYVSGARLSKAEMARRLQVTLNRDFNNPIYLEGVLDPAAHSTRNRILQVLGAAVLKLGLLDYLYENRGDFSENYFRNIYSRFNMGGVNYRLADEYPGLYEDYVALAGNAALSRMNFVGCLLGSLFADTSSMREAMRYARQFVGPQADDFFRHEALVDRWGLKEMPIPGGEEQNRDASMAAYEKEIDALTEMILPYFPKGTSEPDAQLFVRQQLKRRFNNFEYPVDYQHPAFFGDAVLEMSILGELWRRLGTEISHQDYETVRQDILSDVPLARVMALFSGQERVGPLSPKALKYEASLVEALAWVVYQANGGGRGKGLAAARNFIFSELVFYREHGWSFEHEVTNRFIDDIVKAVRAKEGARLARDGDQAVLLAQYRYFGYDSHFTHLERALLTQAQFLGRRTPEEIIKIYEGYMAALPNAAESYVVASWLTGTAAIKPGEEASILNRYNSWKTHIDSDPAAEEAMAVLMLARELPTTVGKTEASILRTRDAYREYQQKAFTGGGSFKYGSREIRVQDSTRKTTAALLAMYEGLSGEKPDDVVWNFTSTVDQFAARFGRAPADIEAALPAAALFLSAQYLDNEGFLTVWSGDRAWGYLTDFQRRLGWGGRAMDQTALASIAVARSTVDRVHAALPEDQPLVKDVHAYLHKYLQAVARGDGSSFDYALANYSQYNPAMADYLEEYSRRLYGRTRPAAAFNRIAEMLRQINTSRQFVPSRYLELLAQAAQLTDIYGARLASTGPGEAAVSGYPAIFESLKPTLADIRSGAYRCLIIDGQPGAGKTTFAQNLVASLRKEGIHAELIEGDWFDRELPEQRLGWSRILQTLLLNVPGIDLLPPAFLRAFFIYPVSRTDRARRVADQILRLSDTGRTTIEIDALAPQREWKGRRLLQIEADADAFFVIPGSGATLLFKDLASVSRTAYVHADFGEITRRRAARDSSGDFFGRLKGVLLAAFSTSGRLARVLRDRVNFDYEIYLTDLSSPLMIRGKQSGSAAASSPLVHGARLASTFDPAAGRPDSGANLKKDLLKRNRDIVRGFNRLDGVVKGVDMGSNSMDFAQAADAWKPGARFIGFDLMPDDLDREFPENLVYRSATRTGVRSGSVDVVTINMPSPDTVPWLVPRMLREAKRILKDGGRVYLVVQSRGYGSPLVDAQKAFAESGLRVLVDGLPAHEAEPSYPETTYMWLLKRNGWQIVLFEAEKRQPTKAELDAAAVRPRPRTEKKDKTGPSSGIVPGARLASAAVSSAPGFAKVLSTAELADFKLYLAALYSRMKEGKDFAVLFDGGLFVFRPSVAEDGSLEVFPAGASRAVPLLTLSTADLKALSEARKNASPSLGSSVAQGALTAMKLQDSAAEDAARVREIKLDAPLAVAFPMSAFGRLKAGELETQVRFQFLRLAKLQRASFGKNLRFYFYGTPDERVTAAVKEEMGRFPGLVEIGYPKEAVVYVDAEEASAPPLGENHVSLPTGKIPAQGVGNWYVLGVQALRAGADAMRDGHVLAAGIDAARVTASVDGYNTLAVSPVDTASYVRIASHAADAPTLAGLMKKHLLRGYVPMPVDITADMVMAQLLRMAEQSA